MSNFNINTINGNGNAFGNNNKVVNYLNEHKNKKSEQSVDILFIEASPKDQSKLKQGQEYIAIEKSLNLGTLEHNLILKLATQPNEFISALIDFNPTFLHIATHGNRLGQAILEDEERASLFFDLKALKPILKDSPNLKCIILNSCHSSSQAEYLSEFIPFVIGINGPIVDKVAIDFSEYFYLFLGKGKSIVKSYECACSVLKGKGYSIDELIELYAKETKYKLI